VLQFGEPKRVVTEPGLHFKLPFVQNAVYIDRRVLDFDAEPQEVILGDQKRLVVDAFARYRILDPLRFYQAVGDEGMLRGRINTILDASLRKVLGEVPLFTVLSADRVALMSRIRESANNEAKQFGIDIVDVRIKRTDLPAENSQAIYRRMQTEREREAKELRAQGAELAQRIRSRADRERRVIIAEAEKEGAIIRGEGDANAVRIFADAVGRDIDFFTFYRSMQAYRAALADDNTSFVLSPNSEFFRYFESPKLPSVEQASGANQPGQPASERAGTKVPVDGEETSIARPPAPANTIE
jgi:membrane protease subunit HflC